MKPTKNEERDLTEEEKIALEWLLGIKEKAFKSLRLLFFKENEKAKIIKLNRLNKVVSDYKNSLVHPSYNTSRLASEKKTIKAGK